LPLPAPESCFLRFAGEFFNVFEDVAPCMLPPSTARLMPSFWLTFVSLESRCLLIACGAPCLFAVDHTESCLQTFQREADRSLPGLLKHPVASIFEAVLLERFAWCKDASARVQQLACKRTVRKLVAVLPPREVDMRIDQYCGADCCSGSQANKFVRTLTFFLHISNARKKWRGGRSDQYRRSLAGSSRNSLSST
jgi:hypothetical protein